MRSAVPLAVAVPLLLVTSAMAGCLAGSGEQTGPADLTAPDDGTRNRTNRTAEEVRNETQNSTVEIRNGTRFDPDDEVHPHDYWGTRDEVTIVEREVEIDWAGTLQARPGKLHRPVFVVDVKPKTDGGDLVPNFVFPGTGSMEVVLTWEGGEGAKRVCVTNSGAGDGFCNRGPERWFAESGELWEIDGSSGDGFLSRESWDPPHSRKSNWRFAVWLCANGQQGLVAGQCPADLDVSSFELTVTIVRGPDDLPVDPPHFAFYGEQDTISVLDEVAISTSPIQSNWIGQASEQARGRSRAYWYISGFQLTTPPLEGESDVPVVAWGTRVVDIALGVDAANADLAPLVLKYRSAADAWSDPWREAGDPCSDACEYAIPVEGGESDSPYSHQTQWEFGIFPADTPSQPLVDYEVTIQITARRSP